MDFLPSNLWDILTKPKKKKVPTPQTFTGGVGGTTAGATPSLWDRQQTQLTVPGRWSTEVATAGGATGGVYRTRAQPQATPAPAPTPFQPIRLPQQTPIQPIQRAPQAPTSPLQGLNETINNWLTGGQQAAGQIGQAFQQPGPFGAAPVGAVPAQEPTMPPGPTQPPEEPNWWERTVTPWWEETAKPWLGEIFGQQPAPVTAQPSPLPQPTPAVSTGAPQYPSLAPGGVEPIPPGWPKEPLPTGQPEYVPPEADWWVATPGAADAMRRYGFSDEQIQNMSYEDAVAFDAQQQMADITGGISTERNLDQWLIQNGYFPQALEGLSYEDKLKMRKQLEDQQRQAGVTQGAAMRRGEWATPEAEAQRGAVREEAYEWELERDRRAREIYWSPKEVANREKVREESRKSAKEYELRGWDTYFDFLDDAQLSPDANEYWNNPARLQELRSRWEAAGKKVSWMTFLKNYDLKGEFATKTYRERMGTAARMAPRMKGVSF